METPQQLPTTPPQSEKTALTNPIDVEVQPTDNSGE